jgi:enediyne biosynthesis protein E4
MHSGTSSKNRQLMRNKRLYLFIVPVLLLLPYVTEAQGSKVVFTDITKKAGIDFKYTFGDNTYKNILESSGSGVTVFDYNNDGYMDIFLMNGTWLEGISDADGKVNAHSHNELYRNNGNGTFTKVTLQAGLGKTYWSMAAGAVDLDNDG